MIFDGGPGPGALLRGVWGGRSPPRETATIWLLGCAKGYLKTKKRRLSYEVTHHLEWYGMCVEWKMYCKRGALNEAAGTRGTRQKQRKRERGAQNGPLRAPGVGGNSRKRERGAQNEPLKVPGAWRKQQKTQEGCSKWASECPRGLAEAAENARGVLKISL